MRPIACLAAVLCLSTALPAQEGFKPPPSPDVAWVKGAPRVVELDAKDPGFKTAKTWPVPASADGRFLYGPTPGFDVKTAGGLTLLPRTADGSKADPIVLKATERRKIPFVYGAGEPVEVPVEFVQGGKWSYRIPAVLEVVAGDVTICLLDADGDGWFDDLDVDLLAVGAAKDLSKLKFAPFTGELTVAGKRYLVAANPREAGLWPVSAGVRKDYIRHAAEINAVRRFGGLPPVGFAEELIPLCEAHSAYCGKWGITHYEEKGKAGYSPEGEWAGLHCNVGTDKDAVENILQCLQTLWHRNMYYFPDLKRVSAGAAGGFVSSDVLTYGHPESRTLIFAPMDRALDVPLESHKESPDPWVTGPKPGPFVTVLLPYDTKASFKWGSVTARGGAAVPFDSSDPANPAPRARQRFPDNDACIVLVLHEVLKADTIYDVKVTAVVGGAEKTYAWSFRTKGK